MQAIKAYGYFFTEPGKPLEKREFTIEEAGADEVVVEVAGCGLCHTDISFYSGAVKTRHELPLVLGHEISGKVVASGPGKHDGLVGKNVIIPAVLPCGDCGLCKDERDNICMAQKMPGNDFNGGFASHIVVPARFLCQLPENLGNYKVSQLSVVADAATTPYQSLVRSGLKEGDLAVVIGVGGIGTYMVQYAKKTGAKVIAVDIDEKKLEASKSQGADFTVSAKGKSDSDVKKEIRGLVKENKLPKVQWKVFETSGSGPGQQTAFALLSYAGTVGIVGFTMDKLNVRLSNLMAFDADIFGNWGCRPTYYNNVVEDVVSGKINIADNIQEFPLDDINDVIKMAMEHKLDKRAILNP